MPSESTNRTLVLSVVAVDLVAYSRKSVAEQMSLKEGFNQVLLQAIRDIEIADRIILDTGDGVAMGFLGDPEDALYVAMFMHDAINRDSTGSPSGSMDSNAIRIGINLGPVKLATGAGGHPNIIGDGINVAERIMGFAEPGQFTASRPFYEVMSRMSDHYATLFQFAGAHADKQVRVHDVYVVGKSTAAFQHAQRGVAERAAARASQPAAAPYVFPPAAAPARGAVAAGHAGSEARSAARTHPAAKVEPRFDTPAAVAPSVRTPATDPVPPSASDSAPPASQGNEALIDFLEDRNKVATTATLLTIVAITLAALLVYRKMPSLMRDSAAPSVAAVSPVSTPASTDPPTDAVPASPPVVSPPAASKPAGALPAPIPKPSPAAQASSIDTRAAPPKTDAKTSSPTPATSVPPKLAAPAPQTNVPSAKPSMAPVTMPPATAKPAERIPPPVTGSEPPAAVPPRDKSRDTRIEKPDRVEKIDKAPGMRDDARKPPSSRAGDRVVPSTAAPVVPAFQSPVDAPRPEIVVPTPAPAAPAPAPPDTSIVALVRNEPAYPLEAARQRIPFGLVKARITIDANGNVSDVAILESRPIQAFGRETRLAAKQWKFNKGAAGRTQEIELSFKP